MCVDNDYLII